MRKVIFGSLVTAALAGVCLGQTRQKLVPAPVAPASAPAFAAHPSQYNFRGVEYPRIEADSRVTFRFKAPDAKRVQVSIVNVPFDMVKGDDGVWTYTSAPQAPGYHNYWMIVDGAIVVDPGTDAFIGYGHMCNGFEIPEPGVDYYDLKDVPHGNVLIKNYFAKTTNSWRRIYVYTPPGYETSSARYPVLYLQHGGGEDERAWIEMGRTNVILDNLLAAGKVKPMIVVMETSAVGGPGEARPGAGAPAAAAPGAAGTPRFGIGGPGGGPYGQFMVKELIPWVDSHFRTLAGREHRAMAGLSMGGMQTAAVTMANLDKFSHIGLFSGGAAVPRRERAGAPPPEPAVFDIKTIYNGAMADPAEFNKRVKVFYFSCGSEENPDALEKHQEQLTAAGITNSYVYISPGTAHEWQTWRRSLYTFAPLLFR